MTERTPDFREQEKTTLFCNGRTIEKVHELLSAPFDDDQVEWRPGGGTWDKNGVKQGFVLCYLTAQAVIRRLDQVAGPGHWQNTLDRIEGGGFKCGLGLRVYCLVRGGVVNTYPGEWLWKTDVSSDSNMEAMKGGASGAIKRAARLWGVGLYLYELPQVVAPLVQRGKNEKNLVIDPKWRPPSQLHFARTGQLHLPQYDEHDQAEAEAVRAERNQRTLPPPAQAPANGTPKVEYTDEPPPWLGEKIGGKKFPDETWAWLLEQGDSTARDDYLLYHADFDRKSRVRHRACIVLMKKCTGRWITERGLEHIDVVAGLRKIGKVPGGAS